MKPVLENGTISILPRLPRKFMGSDYRDYGINSVKRYVFRVRYNKKKLNKPNKTTTQAPKYHSPPKQNREQPQGKRLSNTQRW